MDCCLRNVLLPTLLWLYRTESAPLMVVMSSKLVWLIFCPIPAVKDCYPTPDYKNGTYA